MSFGQTSRVDKFERDFAKSSQFAAQHGFRLLKITRYKYIAKGTWTNGDQSEGWMYVMFPAPCYFTQVKGEPRHIDTSDFDLLVLVNKIARRMEA